MCSLTSRLQIKHPSNAFIDSQIIFKNFRIWVLRHSLKGVNLFLFYLFCAYFLRCYSMEPVHDICFSLCSLTSRLRRKCPSNVVIDSHIILKKCRTGVLRHSLKGPNPIFLILCLFFEVLFDGTGSRYYFFLFFDAQTLEKAPLKCCYRLPHNLKKIANRGT